MQPAISIIVPVFNGEKTLARALHSIRKQTFANFECIIVDDGSTDGTAALANLFALNDPRFQVISTPNRGVSPAKNWGISLAKGAFLTFLDCDDALEPHALETLHTLITETGAGVAIAHIVFEDEEGNPAPNTPPLPELDEIPLQMSAAQAVEIMFRGAPFSGHLHAKLLRADLMNCLLYEEDIFIYEDMLFLLYAFWMGGTVAYTPVVAHHYTVSATGAMNSALTERKASSLSACREIFEHVSTRFPESKKAAARFAYQNALWVLEELANSPASTCREPWAIAARSAARKEIRSQRIPKDLPPVQKLFALSIHLGWPVFFRLYQGPYRWAKKWLSRRPGSY